MVVSGCGASEGTRDAYVFEDAVSHDAGRIDGSTGACFPVTAIERPPVRHALAVRTRESLEVYAARGETFQSILSAPGLAHYSVVAWGDVDGDGLDEVASHWFWLPPGMSTAGVQIYGDHGQGLAVQQTMLTPGVLPSAIDWLRIDDDARDDLWTNDSYATGWCSDGALVTWCWAMGVASNTADRVAHGDGDHDGDHDLAVQVFGEVVTYRNTGAQFAEARRVPVAAADIDWVELDGCDGDELVINLGAAGATTWQVLRWDGSTYADVPLAPPPEVGEMWWADFDRDGDADPLVCTSKGPTLYRRAGESYQLVRTFDGVGCGAAWGDADADGDLDLAYTSLLGDDAAVVFARNDGVAFVEVARIAGGHDGALEWGRCSADATSPCFPSSGSQR